MVDRVHSSKYQCFDPAYVSTPFQWNPIGFILKFHVIDVLMDAFAADAALALMEFERDSPCDDMISFYWNIFAIWQRNSLYAIIVTTSSLRCQYSRGQNEFQWLFSLFSIFIAIFLRLLENIAC